MYRLCRITCGRLAGRQAAGRMRTRALAQGINSLNSGGSAAEPVIEAAAQSATRVFYVRL
jgi:hypothetical protein